MKVSKKLVISAVAGIVLASGVTAQSITLKNTVGGDSDNLPGDDFLIFTKDKDSGNLNKADIGFGDRLQLDVKSEKIDSRIRLEFEPGKLNGKDTATRIRAYVGFNPWNFLTIAAGNNFFSKYAVSGSYLVANDDNDVHGKLLADNGVGAIVKVVGLKLAAGFASESKMNMNLAASYDIKDVVSLAVTAQNITEETRSISAFAGLLAVDGLTFNAGYTYNYHGGFLPETENAVQVSAGYSFEDIKLSLTADALFGLSKKVGNGNGDAEYDGNPYSFAVLAGYGATEDLSVKVKASFGGVGDTTNFVLYPYFDYNTGIGTFRAGVRTEFDKDGFQIISIPFNWEYKFKIK